MGNVIQSFDEYQGRANATAIYPESATILYPTLGLTGEAGEVAEKIKKVIRDTDGEFTEEKKVEIAKELGDVLWYVAALCRDLDVSLMEVANRNIEKLESRKKRGVLKGSGDNR